MRFLDVTLDALEDPAMQFTTQPQVSGTEGGHTLSLQYLAQRGITLLGRLRDIEDGVLQLDDDLAANIAFADERSAQFKTAI